MTSSVQEARNMVLFSEREEVPGFATVSRDPRFSREQRGFYVHEP